MLRLGKLTDYGTVLMTALAEHPDQRMTAHQLARRCRVAEPTAGKLLRQLAHAGLVQAERGAHGGYRLARTPEQISIAEIVTALEGPIRLTECAGDHGRCTIEDSCGVRRNWRLINGAIATALESVSLAQLARPLPGSGSLDRAVPLNRYVLVR